MLDITRIPFKSLLARLAATIAVTSPLACGDTGLNGRVEANPVRSMEIKEVKKVDLAGHEHGSFDIKVMIDDGLFSIKPPFTRIGADQEWYVGRYFYDLQSKCLANPCTRVALLLTVRVAGGRTEDLKLYRQEFLNADLLSGQLSDRLRRGGEGEAPRLDDFVSGRITDTN